LGAKNKLALLTHTEETESAADDPESVDLEIAEEELIDAYVRDDLSAEERKLLAKGLRSSSRLTERLHFARMLATAAASAQPHRASDSASADSVQSDSEGALPPWWKGILGFSVQRPAFQLALAGCAILVVLGGVALFAGWMRLRSESNRLVAERAAIEQQRLELERKLADHQLSTEQVRAELERARQQREADEKLIAELKQTQKRSDQTEASMASTLPVFLFPGSTRGAGPVKEVSITRDTSAIRLNLVLEAGDYPKYNVEITNSQGAKILQPKGLRPRHSRSGPMLPLQVSTQLLPPGDYTILVTGVTSSSADEPVNNYPFRVIQKQE
jgi:hypothetical protein